MTADMEFATDLMTSLRGRIDASGKAADTGAIDWFSLQTRFAAARAARRALACGESAAAAPVGGFGVWAGRQGAPDHASPNINPIDLAVRKGPAGMNGVAADQASGGRG